MAGQSLMTLQEFLKDHIVKSYKKGEIIIFQGEAPRASYVIKKGVIKIYNLSAGGDEKPVGFQTENEIFPSPWTFYRAPSALYYYEALTDLELYLIPRDEFLEFIKKNPDAMFEQLERFVKDYLGSMMRLN